MNVMVFKLFLSHSGAARPPAAANRPEGGFSGLQARKNRLTIVNFILYLKRNSGMKNLEKEVVQGDPVLVISRQEKRSLYPPAFNHENQKKWRKS
jgi:hypothetical protein